MKNLFYIIRQQIIKNEIFGKEPKFTFDCTYYPEKVITSFTKQKAFKVDKVDKKYIDNKFVYTIHYKDVYTESEALSKAYNALKNKEEYKNKRGYYSNESVVQKFLHINDEYRDELECKNYAKEKYEYLDKADDCTFELFLASIGFNNYEDYLLYVEKYPLEDKDIDLRYRQFLNEHKEDRTYAEDYLY